MTARPPHGAVGKCVPLLRPIVEFGARSPIALRLYRQTCGGVLVLAACRAAGPVGGGRNGHGRLVKTPVLSYDSSIGAFRSIGGEGWLNQQVFRVLPPNEESRRFTYILVEEYAEVFIEIAWNKRTTGLGHLKVQDLPGLFVAYPPEEVMRQIAQAAGPMFSRFLLNRREISTLVELRDTLLPKLMSGEVRVKDM